MVSIAAPLQAENVTNLEIVYVENTTIGCVTVSSEVFATATKQNCANDVSGALVTVTSENHAYDETGNGVGVQFTEAIKDQEVTKSIEKTTNFAATMRAAPNNQVLMNTKKGQNEAKSVFDLDRKNPLFAFIAEQDVDVILNLRLAGSKIVDSLNSLC